MNIGLRRHDLYEFLVVRSQEMAEELRGLLMTAKIHSLEEYQNQKRLEEENVEFYYFS